MKKAFLLLALLVLSVSCSLHRGSAVHPAYIDSGNAAVDAANAATDHHIHHTPPPMPSGF